MPEEQFFLKELFSNLLKTFKLNTKRKTGQINVVVNFAIFNK